MFSPSDSSMESRMGGLGSPMMSSNKNHITSRVKRSKRKSSSSQFKIPSLSSSPSPSLKESAPSSTPKSIRNKMVIRHNGSKSRAPFSPLTNSIDRRIGRSDRQQSDDSFASASTSISNPAPLSTKRVIHFGSPTIKQKKQRAEKDPEHTSTKNTHEAEVSNTHLMIHTDAEMNASADNETRREEESQTNEEKEFEISFRSNVTPSPVVLETAYNHAIKHCTHQKYLRSINCSNLSFSEVIIPSIFRAFKDELKLIEGKAKGKKVLRAVKRIQSYRYSLKCREQEMICEAEEAREEREIQVMKEKERQKQLLIQQQLERNEQIKAQKEEALLAKRKEIQQAKERRRFQRKKEFKKNRELYKEIAHSMAELLQIEKEEKLWREVDCEAFTRLFEVNGEDNLEGEELADTSDANNKSSKVKDASNKVQLIVNGTTTSANRIHEALQCLPGIMEQSEVARSDLYDQYKKNHKFDGYRAQKDPKSLIRALTLD
jgi:hypothetical protein